MSAVFLSKKDVETLTGYSSKLFQAKFCKTNGISHFVNSRGEVIVPISSLHRQTISADNTEPDFGQFLNNDKTKTEERRQLAPAKGVQRKKVI